MSTSPKHHPTPSGQAPKPKSILKNPLDRRPSQPGPAGSPSQMDMDDASNIGVFQQQQQSTTPLTLQTQGMSPTGAHHGPNGLTWDESNIALHDFEKESTQRMKIDEPKTPFVRGSELDSQDEGGFDSFALDSQSPGGANSTADGNTPRERRGSAAAELAANTSANASLGGARRPSGTSAAPGPSGSNTGSAIGLDAADLAMAGAASSGAPSSSALAATDGDAARSKARSQSRSPSFSLPSSGSSSRRASSRGASSNQGGGPDDSRSGVRRENQGNAGGADGEEAIVGVDDEDEEDAQEDAETRAQREAFAKKRNAHYGNEAEALRVAQALAAKDDEDEDDEDDDK